MGEKDGDNVVILKAVEEVEQKILYLVPKASEAIDLLWNVLPSSTKMSNDLPVPEVIDLIKKLKNVTEPKRIFRWETEFATPMWNNFTEHGLELVGLNPEQIQTLHSILQVEMPCHEKDNSNPEQIPQLLFTLKILEYDEPTFQSFMPIMRKCPSVGMMMCQILCDDDLLEKAQPFLDEDPFDKREILQQYLKEELQTCCDIGIFHFVSACGEHIKSIVSNEISIDFSWKKLNITDRVALHKVASNLSLIKEIRLRDFLHNDDSVAVLMDGLNRTNVKVRCLNVSGNDKTDIITWSRIGVLVKNHEVEELDISWRGLTCEKVNEFNKSCGNCKFRHLTVCDRNAAPDVFFLFYDMVNSKIESFDINTGGIEYRGLKEKVSELNIVINKDWSPGNLAHLGSIVSRHEVKSIRLVHPKPDQLRAFTENSGDSKIYELDVSYNCNIDVNGWSCIGEIVKSHEVEKLDFSGCDLTYEKVYAFNKSSGDCKICHLNVSWNQDTDMNGWGCIGDLVKNHEVEELKMTNCYLTYDKVDAFNKNLGDCKIRYLDVSWNTTINVNGWSHIGNLVKVHEVKELGMTRCGLTYEKVDAFNKSSGDCKIRKLQLGIAKNSPQPSDLLLAAIAEISLRVKELLHVENLFKLDEHHYERRETETETIEGLVFLQDFIHIQHPSGLKVKFPFSSLSCRRQDDDHFSSLDSHYSGEEYVRRFALTARESEIFVVRCGYEQLIPIESRIKIYRRRFPSIQWGREACIGESGQTLSSNEASTKDVDRKHVETMTVALKSEIPTTEEMTKLKEEPATAEGTAVEERREDEEEVKKDEEMEKKKEDDKDADKLRGLPTYPSDEECAKNSAELEDELQMILRSDITTESKSNALIEFSEKLMQNVSGPFKLGGILISVNNCFGITVLAKQFGNSDLQRAVNSFIIKNLKMIIASESLKTLSTLNFKRYLERCDLPHTMKLDLIEGKFAYIDVTGDRNFQKPDRELIMLAAELLGKYRYKYSTLTTYCQMALKHQLSDSNCLETAIFAKKYRLDELKVWAEHHVIVNFESILPNILTYSKRDVSMFCEFSRIPVEMQQVLKDHNGPYLGKSDFKEMGSKWLLSRLRELSSVTTKVIGTQGGIIELDGCSVKFPAGALTKDTQIALTINTAPENYPNKDMGITPILGVEPSISLAKPVSITMKTCFRASDGQTVIAQLFVNDGYNWKEDKKIHLGSNCKIHFNVDHFCSFCSKIDQAHKTADGKYVFYNDVYIEKDSGRMTSCFYCHDKDGYDMRKNMRGRNSFSFSSTPLRIEGGEDEAIRLDIVLDEPEDDVLAKKKWLPNCDSVKDALRRSCFSIVPGKAVWTLQPESFVSGIYTVFVGSGVKPHSCTEVIRKWPITPDPEQTSRNITANTYNEGGFVFTENKDSKQIVADAYKAT